MRRTVLLAALAAAPLAGQYRGPRGADYLFTASAADARALWVNPAGLGVEFEASVMAEALVDRSRSGDLALNQLAAGFNSRGLAFGYRRDAYHDTLTGHTYRIGAGRALERVAVGFGLSFHSNGDGPTQRGLDLGVRYRLARVVELGVVVREIGKPVVHDVPLEVNGTAGIGVHVLPGIRLDAEGTLASATGGGTARRWRGGLALGPARLGVPLALAAALDLDQDMAPARLILALTVGGRDRLVATASGARPGGSLELDAVSLTGVASRVP